MYNSQNVTRKYKVLRLHLITISLLLSFCLSQATIAQAATAMWGDLTAGPHGVGYRTLFKYDLSRDPIPYTDWDGRLYPTDQQPGRQMQINIWYPATITAEDQKLTFGDYVDLMARQTDFGPMNQEKRQFANEVFISKTNSLGGNGTFTAEKLDALRKMQTAAYSEASPKPGKFPLVVFPNGGSPAFQSIMSEYFASHGFIVAAGALKGQYGMTEDISAKGFEITADDLGFLISQALEIEQADPQKVCLIGNAITASQNVAYLGRNSRINCLVSLDGGFPSRFDQSILRQTNFYDPQDIYKPILVIYAPHPSIDPEYLDHLKYATQFRFHFPQMSEYHFLNYGALERLMPGIIGEPEGDVTRGFELAAMYSLKFFQTFLQANQESEQFLLRKPAQDVSTHVTKAEIKQGLTLPPNVTTVKNAYLENGIGYLQEVYRNLKKNNPTPFAPSFYSTVKDWLAYRKDPTYENRYQLYQLALDSYPESAMVNYDLAYFALRTGRDEIAMQLSNKTLELLDTGTSENLTQARKSQMRENVLEDINTLNQKQEDDDS